MKLYHLIHILIFFFCTNLLFAQSPNGIWETVDEQTGEAQTWIEIYEKEGIFYGKIVKILRDDPNAVCSVCEGKWKDAPILGLEIISGLQAYKDYWNGGDLLFPENGNTYSCYIKLNAPDELSIRGYIGYPFLGRTQTWKRIQ